MTSRAFWPDLDPPPDLICSDYYMPQFDAPRALVPAQGTGAGHTLHHRLREHWRGHRGGGHEARGGGLPAQDRLARLGRPSSRPWNRSSWRDEKRQLEQALKSYLSMLAHELRNPLAPILASLGVLRRTVGRRCRDAAGDPRTIGRPVRHLAGWWTTCWTPPMVAQGRCNFGSSWSTSVDLARSAAEDAAHRRRLVEQPGSS